jgi:hypothetical protein
MNHSGSYQRVALAGKINPQGHRDHVSSLVQRPLNTLHQRCCGRALFTDHLADQCCLNIWCHSNARARDGVPEKRAGAVRTVPFRVDITLTGEIEGLNSITDQSECPCRSTCVPILQSEHLHPRSLWDSRGTPPGIHQGRRLAARSIQHDILARFAHSSLLDWPWRW